MSSGQRVLGTSVLDVGALDRIGARIEAREQERSVQYGEQLRDALALHRVYEAAGMGISSPAELALLLSCSEARAATLLMDAEVLDRIGAMGDAVAGLVTVEQVRVVVDLLHPVDVALAGRLWERLREQLVADRATGAPRPPARLRELLTRRVIAADPDGFVARRKNTMKSDADVSLWSREDGLVDLTVSALTGAVGRACMDRIDAMAQLTGPDDGRTTGELRRDAVVDAILGRSPLPTSHVADSHAGRPAGAGCGCPPGRRGSVRRPGLRARTARQRSASVGRAS